MRSFFTVCVFLLSTIGAYAQQGPGMVGSGGGVDDNYDFIGVNRMLMWIANNGSTSHAPSTDGAGLEWPQGSGRYMVYQEGLVMGGRVQGEIHIGGSTYRQGLHAGPIQADGSASDPGAPSSRIFKAHRFEAAWWNALPPVEQARLLKDLIEWPVDDGAPWVDANANGVYDPDADNWKQGGLSDTPLLPGDEVLWFVSNDLDGSRTSNLYGTPPMGLEVQTMAWASSGHPLLQNVIFREYTIINKGTDDIDDMHLAAWEDCDFGSPFDDLVGVDTGLGLSYTYNGISFDDVYGVPPATGTLWLQSTIVPSPGQTARYGLDTREGFANQTLSAFSFYINSDLMYQDPDLGTWEGSQQMMNNLSGLLYDGAPYIDPTTGRETVIPLSGDPVLAQGWIDGIIHAPYDRRHMSVCGNYTLAKGDTQKIILARIAVEGGNHLLSVRALRNAARQLQDIYRNIPMGSQAPVFSYSTRYPADGEYAVQVSGGPFPAGTTLVEGMLRDAVGNEILRIALADDGQHDDGAAGDGIYGGTLAGNAWPSGADLFVFSTDADGTKEWFVESDIALPGDAVVKIAEVVSDSRNFDGKVNPGENVRLRLRIENNSGTTLGPWHLFLRDSISMNADRNVLRYDLTTSAHGSSEPAYDPQDGNSYLGFAVPESTPPGTVLQLPATLISENHCLWNFTISIEVQAFGDQPITGFLEHVEGLASGTLGYTVVDRTLLKDDIYRVSIEGDDFGTKSMHVENVSLGTTLYRGLPIPDYWGHETQIIDGWRITIGTAFDELYYDQSGDIIGSFQSVVGEFSEPSRSWFAIYNNTLSTGEQFFGSRKGIYDEVPVRLIFDRSNGQKAMAWLRGGSPSYGYQGYFDIPVRAYDISDTANPRQLMVGFVEQYRSIAQDNNWRPTTSAGDREYLFVFADDYSTQVDPKFQQSIMAASDSLDALYGLWAILNPAMPDYQDGDAYTITPRIPISNRDVYIFPRPHALDVRTTPSSPEAIALHPNYPNPFGAASATGSSSTTISFDTPRSGHVFLAVHDILGRRVTTLVDQTLNAGTHSLSFNAASLRAGSYLLALETNGTRRTRMMMVVK
ncbi:MAG: choice-of-anchor X domain-containing protein [Bacteroidota bacterium]